MCGLRSSGLWDGPSAGGAIPESAGERPSVLWDSPSIAGDRPLTCWDVPSACGAIPKSAGERLSVLWDGHSTCGAIPESDGDGLSGFWDGSNITGYRPSGCWWSHNCPTIVHGDQPSLKVTLQKYMVLCENISFNTHLTLGHCKLTALCLSWHH